MGTTNRNHCMDTIKGVACLLVVFIHYNWSGGPSEAIKAIGRFAVPYFFFIAGYHLPDGDDRITTENTARKIKHILSLTLKSAVFYGIFCICWNYLMDHTWNIGTFLQEELSLAGAVKLLISCDPFVYAHFWYLIASVLCYLIVYFVRDMPGKTGYLAAFAVLLCTYSLLAEFNHLVGWNNYYQISEDSRLVLSNIFVLRAMPFFLFGIFLRKAHIAQCRSISFLILLAMLFAGCVLAVLEQRRYGTILMYTGNHLMVIALSLISIWYPGKKLRVLEYVGSKLSMDVYIYHIAAGKVLDLAATKLHLWGIGWFKSLRPVLVLVLSLLFAQMLVTIRKRKKQKARTM